MRRGLARVSRKATLGLVAPRPTRYMTRYSPGYWRVGAGDQRKVGGMLRDNVRAILNAGRRGTIQRRQHAGRGGHNIQHLGHRDCVIDADNDGELLSGAAPSGI